MDDLVVPEEFNSIVESTLLKIKALADRIDSKAYKVMVFMCATFF